MKKIGYLLMFPVLLIANKVSAEPPATGIDVTGLASGNLETYIQKGINVFIGIAGVLSVIFIIVGGFQYITAGTSKDGATKAKQTLTYAIIGLVIVLLALVIRNYVFRFAGLGTETSIGTLTPE